MRGAIRKTVAITAGLFIFLVVVITPATWVFFVASIADDLTSKRLEKIWGRFPHVNIQSNYYLYFFLGLAVAVGLSVTFVIWDFEDKARKVFLLYIPFMVILLLFSSYNYYHADLLIRFDVQVIFNLLLILLSIMCIVKTWLLKTRSSDAIVLKYFILFLLLLNGVLIPLVFSFIWLINKLGINQIDIRFDMPIITTISGIITTLITVLKFRDDKKKLVQAE